MALHDPSMFSMDEISKASCMVTDVFLEEDMSSVVAGVTYIVDVKGTTADHMLQMTPQLIKKSVTIWQVT